MKKLTYLLFPILLSGCVTNIYLVRHAEKMDSSQNPPLSELGEARALALRDSLSAKGIDRVYATPYIRTQKTAQPTADALGLPVTTYGTDTTFQFAQAIRKIKGENLLVVGHSNTVPEMVLYLTGDTVHIGHDDYDNLYKVRISRGLGGVKSSLTEKKYGE